MEDNIRFNTTIQILQNEIQPDADVLEVGSNDGSFREHIHKTQSWTTIDKYGDPDVQVDLNTRTLHLPFEDNHFDVIICTEVLEHLSMGSPLVAEFFRVLKPNGKFYVSVPNIVSLTSRLKWITGNIPFMAASGDCGHPLGGTGVLIDGWWEAAHVVDFNAPRLKGFLTRQGFVIEHQYKTDATVKNIPLPSFLVPLSMVDFVFLRASKRA